MKPHHLQKKNLLYCKKKTLTKETATSLVNAPRAQSATYTGKSVPHSPPQQQPTGWRSVTMSPWTS